MGEHHDNVIIYTERSSYIYIHIYMCMCVHISYLQATRTVRHCYRWAWFADVRNVSHTKHTRTNVLGFLVSLVSPPPPSSKTHSHAHTEIDLPILYTSIPSIRHASLYDSNDHLFDTMRKYVASKFNFTWNLFHVVALLLLLHILIFYKNINFFRCVSISSTKICHMKYIRVLCIHTSLSELESWIEPS